MRKKFRCIWCGELFELSDDEYKAYEKGYYVYEPDQCDECSKREGFIGEWENYSDADPGL